MPTQSTLVTLLVAGLAAIAAIASALVAGYFALRTRRAEGEAQRVRDLEERISERKYTTYEPMINLLSEMLTLNTPTPEEAPVMVKKLADFSTWISIYGSDEAVLAFHNWMQAIYSTPPLAIQLRLYGDFLIAARNDMGNSQKTIGRQHLLGMRIKDIYKYADIVDPSFDEVCERLNWRAPWLADDVVPHEAEPNREK